MTETLTGGCLCGAVRYRVAPGGMRLAPYACHCIDCQTRSGSAFGIQLGVGEADLSIDGKTIEGRHVQPSGAVAQIVACKQCLTRIYTTNDRRPGIANLRAGTLDDSAGLIPAFHLFVAQKQPWVAIPSDVPALDGQPADMTEWMTLFAGTWK
jgi:hypothetical protein